MGIDALGPGTGMVQDSLEQMNRVMKESVKDTMESAEKLMVCTVEQEMAAQTAENADMAAQSLVNIMA